MLGTPPPAEAVRLFALRQVLLGGLMMPSFAVDRRWVQAIQPSEDGLALLDKIGAGGAGRSFSDAEAHFILFRMFYDLDLLVSVDDSDAELASELIHDALTKQHLKIPHRFGRKLYDRFNDDFRTTRTDHLMYPFACELLDGQAQGVCQMGYAVTGPLGLLSSASGRYTPPSLRVPLWHCSDTGCEALHRVRLLDNPEGYAGAVEKLRQDRRQKHGPPSEWVAVLSRYIRGDDQPRAYFDIAAFLADALTPKELDALFRFALATRVGPAIRLTLDECSNGAPLGSGRPDEIADRLSHVQQLQAALCCSDDDLVWLLDEGVRTEVLQPSASRTRRSRHVPSRVCNGDTKTELGRLGARSTRGNSMASLAMRIWSAYESNGLVDDLKWHLRSHRGQSPRVALMNYLRDSDLGTTVQDLVLSNPRVTQYFQDCLTGLELTGERQRDIDTLLWKAGFDLPVFMDGYGYSRLRDRLTAFDEVVLSAGRPLTEDDMEGIRGIGVNLFVSVEAFIEELLAYQIWLLSSDHFVTTQFEYSHAQACSRVPDVLGTQVTAGSETFTWSVDGKNNLSTLLAYLSATAEWAAQLPSTDPEPLLRPTDDLPFYAEDPHLEFPFRHTQLWADCDQEELRTYVGALEEVVKKVNRSRSAEVRNGIDHKRRKDEYPDPDTMRAAVMELRDALDLADTQRLIPKAFWLTSVKTDRAGRQIWELYDYRGRTLVLHGPNLTWRRPDYSYDQPKVVAPMNLLGLPNGEITFYIHYETEYERYWSNYPRRRRIPPGEASDDSQGGSADGNRVTVGDAPVN